MGITEMLSDVKNHLEHGAELVASHLPALDEWASRAESDPLVQAAIDLVVPESTRSMLAGFLKTVEAEVRQVGETAAAAEQQRAAAETVAAAPQPDTAQAG